MPAAEALSALPMTPTPDPTPPPTPCCCRVQLSGERYSLMQAVELLSWRLRASPPLERPGGPSPALRALKPNIAPAPGYGTPGYGGFVPGGYAYGR